MPHLAGRIPRLLVSTLAVIVVAGACGEPSEDAAPVTPTVVPTEVASATPDPAPTPTVAVRTATPEPTQPATAPVEVPEAMRVSYTELADGTETAVAVLRARDGSYRVDRPDSVVAYDAQTLVLTVSALDASASDGESSIVVTTGAANAGSPPVMGYALADKVLVEGQVQGRGEAEYDESWARSVIRYSADLVPNAIGGGPDHVEAVVDAVTGVPLSYVATDDGEVVRSLEALEVDALRVRPDVFSVDGDPTEPPRDAGFVAATLGEVDELVGRPTLVPTVAPDGFELVAIAVAPGVTANASGPEGANPLDTDVVQLRYQRGWSMVDVVFRSSGGDPAAWDDPFSGEGQPFEAALVVLTEGPFTGSTAAATTAPEMRTHLWVADDEVVLTIVGPLTVDEMVMIVESLVVA